MATTSEKLDLVISAYGAANVARDFDRITKSARTFSTESKGWLAGLKGMFGRGSDFTVGMKTFMGGGALLGLGYASKRFAEMGESINKFVTQFKLGEISVDELKQRLIESIPILGGVVKGIREMWDAYTGVGARQAQFDKWMAHANELRAFREARENRIDTQAQDARRRMRAMEWEQIKMGMTGMALRRTELEEKTETDLANIRKEWADKRKAIEENYKSKFKALDKEMKEIPQGSVEGRPQESDRDPMDPLAWEERMKRWRDANAAAERARNDINARRKKLQKEMEEELKPITDTEKDELFMRNEIAAAARKELDKQEQNIPVRLGSFYQSRYEVGVGTGAGIFTPAEQKKEMKEQTAEIKKIGHQIMQAIIKWENRIIPTITYAPQERQ